MIGMSPHRNESGSMDGTNRANVKAGLRVLIVLKKDQHSGKLTEGIVKDILTKSPTHPMVLRSAWKVVKLVGLRK